jgi:MbtH protein
MNKDDTEDTKYKVVVNDEEQYSIWAVDRPNPCGWRDAAKSGSKSECLTYIKEVWTDMRPLSLRKKMENSAIVVEHPGVNLNGNHLKANEEKS